MRYMTRYAMAAALLVCCTGKVCQANIVTDTYSVSATLEYGGTLNGTFTTTTNTATDTTTVTSWDIVAPASSGTPGHAFPGFEYDTGDSVAVISFGASTTIDFDSPSTTNLQDQLRLVFTGALPTTLVSLNATHSYESEHTSGGNRTLTGTLTAVPEPASITLSASALATVLALVWMQRRRRDSALGQIA